MNRAARKFWVKHIVPVFRVAVALSVLMGPRTTRSEDTVTPILTLEEIQFEGRVYFRDETLRGFFRHRVPDTLDINQLHEDVARVESRYRERGYLAAEVSFSLETPGRPDRRVARVHIRAGERARLLSVHVVGNRLVSEAALLAGLFSRPPEPLGALTRAGFFHRPYLDQDAQRLIANYYRRGFLEARVRETRVTADPDLDGIHVHFDVHEGAVYELAELTFTGDLPEGETDSSLRAQIPTQDGEVADLVTLQQQADRLLNLWRNLGYPFARVEQSVSVLPAPSGDEARRGIGLRLKIVKGPKTLVRAIRIAGTPGTRPHVLLREVSLREGEPYDHAKLLESQDRLMRLGFFQQVNLRPVPTADEGFVDVEVQVTEQPTWIFSPTAFVAAEGLVGVLVAGDRNLLGSGMYGSFVGQVSLLRQLFDVSLMDPHFANTDIVMTAEAHRRELGYPAFRIRAEGGGGVRLSFPLPWRFRLALGLSSELTGVVPYEEIPVAKSALLPQGIWRNVTDVSFAYDHRDSLLLPRNGVLAELRASYSGPFTLSGVSALDVTGNLRMFWSPFAGITWKSNTEVGAVWNPEGGEVAVTDRYFLGYLGSVRGYFPRSIAPSRAVATEGGEEIEAIIGGVVRFVQNVEVEFPLWPQSPVRGFLFVDAGNAFDEGERLFSDTIDRGTVAPLPLGLFWAMGGGMLLETPVLPLRFQWSVPLTRRPSDRELDFFVGVGSAF